MKLKTEKMKYFWLVCVTVKISHCESYN